MMKNKLILLVCALTAVRLAAETLTTDTAVFAQTDPKSPVLTQLKSGSVVNYVGEAPAGWKRIEITDPIMAYVHNRDITKGLEVREDANIYAAPKKGAQVLTVFAKGDKAEITGLRGDYCQLKLEKPIQGFIATGANVNTPAPLKTDPASPAPVMKPVPLANPGIAPGRPAPRNGNTADMPRLFAGRLVLARRAIVNPNPLYDYQLMDGSGRRFAYVDTKRLLLTEKIEAYLDREIAITGTIRNTVDGKDLVIAAESMQLK